MAELVSQSAPEQISQAHMTLKKGEMGYRPDIDGLRAIAVSLVLLDHLKVAHVLGGFVGVDIFFVISGYLITGNISRLLIAGKFSLAGFYERRFRRIVPALIPVLAFASAAAFFVALPSDLMRFGRVLLASFFSYSNLYLYWTKSGYFGASYTQFLLHTWSLGVEEQFYLVVPMAMLLFARRDRLMRSTFLGLSAVSFLLASYYAFRNPDLSFYMPFTRAWELLAGSLLALGAIPVPNQRIRRELFAAIGLLLILACATLYKPGIPFPGITALVPCAASLMIILAGGGEPTACGRFLSCRPVVFLGLISYSLYLWHWPLIVLAGLGAFPRIRLGNLSGQLALLSGSILLAILSWKFVEQPFRSGRFRSLSRKAVFASVASSALIVGALALLLETAAGMPGRFPPDAVRVSHYLDVLPTMQQGSCFVETGFPDFDKAHCLNTVSNQKNVLLLGDSHAAALWWGLQNQYPSTHFLQATLAACPPTLGQYRGSNCSQMRRFMYESFLPQHHIDAVILSERWSSVKSVDDIESAIRWFQSHNVPVVVVGPVPEYTAPLPYLLALGMKRNDPELPGRNRVAGLQLLDNVLRTRLHDFPGVTYASVWDAICSGDSCGVYADEAKGIPMLGDMDHLTDQGSLVVIRKLGAAGKITFP